MHLTRLALTDFRNYAEADVALGPGVTTFIGANGQGKTNLVEAARFAATFESHRVATDAPLIRAGADRAIVRAGVRAAGRDSLLEIEINGSRANRVRLNRAPVPRPRSALGVLRCVLFAPEDLAMVKGDPDQRRRFLDDLLVAGRPRYAGVRADYERVLRQRSALLKSAKARGRVPPEAMEVWDDHLVSTGAELTAARLRLVEQIRPLVTECYGAISGTDRDTAMRYQMSACRQAGDYVADVGAVDPGDAGEPAGRSGAAADPAVLAEVLRAALAARRQAELERGVCLVGPHRDELELRIGDMPTRGYASHGESWSLALALRLAAFQLLRADGDDPVLLLDDVFAELDVDRRDRLAGLVADAEQVLVTAAVSADVPTGLAGVRYSVADGVIGNG